MDHFSNLWDMQGKKRRLPNWKGRETDRLGDMWQLLWIWLVPIKMRQTLSPNCQRLFQKARCQQPFKTSVLDFGHCPSPLCSFYWQIVYFSAVTNIILCGIYPSNASLLHTCTLWMHVPDWTAVELLLEGWLLAALALHLHGEWAEGLVVFVLTQLVPPEQRDPRGSGRIPQNWVRRKMQTGRVDLLSPHCLSCLHSASQHQRRSAVIMTNPPVWQGLSGALGSFRKETILKENCSTFKHSSEQVMRVRMGFPRLPGAKRGKKGEVALF